MGPQGFRLRGKEPNMNILHAIDVSRADLVTYEVSPSTEARYLGKPSNSSTGIALVVLRALDARACVVVESTGQDHVALCMACLDAGVPVVVLDGHKVRRFADLMGQRSKTDKLDARIIGSYALSLLREGRLHPLKPVDRDLLELKNLLRKRQALVKARMQLAMAGADGDGVLQKLSQSIRSMEDRIAELCRAHGPLYDRLQVIPGIGPVSGAYLTAVLWNVGDFPSAAALIAFCGLDVVLKESGRFKGKCKLSKRGWAAVRTALVLAARSARGCKTSNPFQEIYLEQEGKGRPKTACACAAARKYLATAWSMAFHDAEYDKDRVRSRETKIKKVA